MTEHISCVRAYTLYLVLEVKTSATQRDYKQQMQQRTFEIVVTKDGVLRVS